MSRVCIAHYASSKPREPYPIVQYTAEDTNMLIKADGTRVTKLGDVLTSWVPIGPLRLLFCVAGEEVRR